MALTWVEWSGVALALVISKLLYDRRGLQLPPGPKGWPIIGNLLDVPGKHPWFVYEKWGKRYGPIISMNVFGQPIVVINSYSIAKELLDRRGTKYSSRPQIPMINLMNFNVANMALQPYGHEWRQTRRVADYSLRPSAANSYRTMQKKNSHRYLRQLLEDPVNFYNHIRHFTTAVAMDIAYGYEIAESNDHFVILAETTVNKGTAAFYPAAYYVNMIPWLAHLPEWLPGMGFKRYARETSKFVQEMIESPFALVKERMANGTATPSLSRDSLLECTNEEDEARIKYVAASIYSAGADTTGSSLNTVLLTLATHPEAQKKAQAELDRVIGRSRLPDYADQENLPYTTALFQELMRWRIASPMGTTRQTTEDDVYENYFIPKGSIVQLNAWAMLHDPEHFPEPDLFKPERFLTKDGKVIEDAVLAAHFGFGRRVCPGRHLALNTIWITLTAILHCFNVRKAKDANGKEIEINTLYSDNLISFPYPFKCSITPRDKTSVELIKATEKMEY
ncbi:hypothetical protein D9758_005996 [Tetrapyrgos nigripes]|uniref:Cytochrome P450 n=1 Tax=Tetrapyrgos nigripes TaxID=182062 RepID=A0A8H5D826_9AGAR|nr:hypothetical protein D9758_005996 [Tetrapyrgos nigripes]